jgi:anti-sigma factor RsiW
MSRRLDGGDAGMSAARELTCREVVELVTDYVEGTMDAELRAAFDAHLVGCDGCTHYVDQIEATIRLAGTIEPRALAPEFRAGLVEAFRDFRRP